MPSTTLASTFGTTDRAEGSILVDGTLRGSNQSFTLRRRATGYLKNRQTTTLRETHATNGGGTIGGSLDSHGYRIELLKTDDDAEQVD